MNSVTELCRTSCSYSIFTAISSNQCVADELKMPMDTPRHDILMLKLFDALSIAIQWSALVTHYYVLVTNFFFNISISQETFVPKAFLRYCEENSKFVNGEPISYLLMRRYFLR